MFGKSSLDILDNRTATRIYRRVMAFLTIAFRMAQKTPPKFTHESFFSEARENLLVLIDAAPPITFRVAQERDKLDGGAGRFLSRANSEWSNIVENCKKFESLGGTVLVCSPAGFPGPQELGFGLIQISPNSHLRRKYLRKFRTVFFAGMSLSDCVIGRASGYILAPHKNKVLLPRLSIQIDPVRSNTDVLFEVGGLKLWKSHGLGPFGQRDKSVSEEQSYDFLQLEGMARVSRLGCAMSIDKFT